MALKAYRKSTLYAATAVDAATLFFPLQTNSTFVLRDASAFGPSNPTTVWGIFSTLNQALKHLVASSSTAGMIIPVLLIFAGLGFLYLQVQPTITQEVKAAVGTLNQGTTPLVQESYIESKLQFVSNPGSDYFKQLTDAAIAQGYQPDKESLAYSGTLYISIPRLGMNRLPISANVESGVEEAYRSALRSALAHFKGTSLPGSSDPQNIVIYGHSAGGSYNPSPSDVLAAFTFLPELQVGDEIILEQAGETYKYRMLRSKIVQPQDVEIITGTPGKETLTLFTCWPPGNNNSRYVATAVPV